MSSRAVLGGRSPGASHIEDTNSRHTSTPVQPTAVPLRKYSLAPPGGRLTSAGLPTTFSPSPGRRTLVSLDQASLVHFLRAGFFFFNYKFTLAKGNAAHSFTTSSAYTSSVL